MPTSPALSKKTLAAKVGKMTDRSLRELETILTIRMGNIAKFCPWPALEESLAQDIAMIWREQKIRDMTRAIELTCLGSTQHKMEGKKS